MYTENKQYTADQPHGRSKHNNADSHTDKQRKTAEEKTNRTRQQNQASKDKTPQKGGKRGKNPKVPWSQPATLHPPGGGERRGNHEPEAKEQKKGKKKHP